MLPSDETGLLLEVVGLRWLGGKPSSWVICLVNPPDHTQAIMTSQPQQANAQVGSPLFCIPHLTRTTDGYVYWRGVSIEHYSHSNTADMERDARKLEAQCLALEAKGFPVNGRTATCQIHAQAPADTPWLEAIGRFYTFFQGDGRTVGVFYRHTTSGEGFPAAVIAEKDTSTGTVQVTVKEGGYEAFHFLQNQGLSSIGPYTSYSQVVSLLEATGLTPEEIHSAVAAAT